MMALNANNNFLFSAGHYEPNQRYNKLGSDCVVNTIETVPRTERRSSSVQSLQTAFFLDTPSASVSHPLLPDFSAPILSPPSPTFPPTTTTAVPLSTRRDKTIESGLNRNESGCSRRKSFAKIQTGNENVSIPTSRSLHTPASLTGVKNAITETNENEQHHFIKKPVEIRVRCIFSRVGEIDTLNERYTAEFFFEASWYDDKEKIGSKYDPLMGHFNPQLVVLNHLGDTLKHEKWYSINKANEDDLVEITEHHKIRGVFWERMELNHFPYDVQELSLSITTPLTTNDIYFIKNTEKLSGVNRIVFSDQQSWHLYEHVEFSYEEHREEYSLNENQVHPVVACTCHVGRKCGYYIWNAYFLIFLITSAALCTFAIPPSNTQGRLQITCTLLLTSVTFRWVVNKSLPPISYLTALDIYAISSIVVLCIINVFHGAISYLYYNQIYLAASQTPLTPAIIGLSQYPEYNLCRLDRYAFFMFCSLFFLYQGVILLCTLRVPYIRRRAMSRKDEECRAELINKNALELAGGRP